MSPNDADGMANSVDPDQTAPVGGISVLKLRIMSVSKVLKIKMCFLEVLQQLWHGHIGLKIVAKYECYQCFFSIHLSLINVGNFVFLNGHIKTLVHFQKGGGVYPHHGLKKTN